MMIWSTARTFAVLNTWLARFPITWTRYGDGRRCLRASLTTSNTRISTRAGPTSTFPPVTSWWRRSPGLSPVPTCAVPSSKPCWRRTIRRKWISTRIGRSCPVASRFFMGRCWTTRGNRSAPLGGPSAMPTICSTRRWRNAPWGSATSSSSISPWWPTMRINVATSTPASSGRHPASTVLPRAWSTRWSRRRAASTLMR